MKRPVFISSIFLTILVLVLSACQPLPATGTPAFTKTPAVTLATPEPADTPTPTSAPSLTPTFPADVQALDGMKVLLWHPWMGGLESGLKAEVEEFNRSNAWGLEVEVRGFGGSAALEDTFNASSEGELPDLLIGSPEALADLEFSTGRLLDLTILLDEPEWGLTVAERTDFMAGIWPPPVLFGDLPGLPILQNARLLIYNSTWAEELGFSSPPATPQEYEQQICAAMQANLKADYIVRGTGGWLLDNDAHTLLGWLAGFDSDFSQDYTFNTPQGLEAFTYLQHLVAEKCVVQLPVARPEPYQPFATRRALVYAGSLADLPMQEQVRQKLGVKDQYDVIPFPALEGAGSIPLFSQDVAILDATHEQELGAWLFVRWLLLSRNQAGLARAGGMLPVTRSGLDELKTASSLPNQYRALLNLEETFQPVRVNETWLVARRALEDAAWQLYQPYTKVESVAGILEALDGMILELK